MASNKKFSNYKKPYNKKKANINGPHPYIECIQLEINTLEATCKSFEELASTRELSNEEATEQLVAKACLERLQTTLQKFQEPAMRSKYDSFNDSTQKHKHEQQTMFILQFFYIVRLGQLSLFDLLQQVDKNAVNLHAIITDIADQLVGAAVYYSKDPENIAKKNHVFDLLRKLEEGKQEVINQDVDRNATFKQVKEFLLQFWENTTTVDQVPQDSINLPVDSMMPPSSKPVSDVKHTESKLEETNLEDSELDKKKEELKVEGSKEKEVLSKEEEKPKSKEEEKHTESKTKEISPPTYDPTMGTPKEEEKPEKPTMNTLKETTDESIPPQPGSWDDNNSNTNNQEITNDDWRSKQSTWTEDNIPKKEKKRHRSEKKKSQEKLTAEKEETKVPALDDSSWGEKPEITASDHWVGVEEQNNSWDSKQDKLKPTNWPMSSDTIWNDDESGNAEAQPDWRQKTSDKINEDNWRNQDNGGRGRGGMRGMMGRGRRPRGGGFRGSHRGRGAPLRGHGRGRGIDDYATPRQYDE